MISIAARHSIQILGTSSRVYSGLLQKVDFKALKKLYYFIQNEFYVF